MRHSATLVHSTFMSMRRIAKRVRANRRAVLAIEYGLIACFISIGILTSVKNLGSHVNTEFSYLASKM